MNAIDVRGVHKLFRIPHERHTTVTERALNYFRRGSYEEFHALRGVDLTVDRGSFVGVIGANGSGKSTLLRIVAGLLLPDSGSVRVDGSMSALLELGLGFSPELTVRENVELYAALLGHPRHQVMRRVDAAIEFAELERFRDAKVKNLSSGMVMRLGFAAALQTESDILLLDEISAAGDASFQKKCQDVFTELRRTARTVLLVSHDLEHIRRFCDHAVLLAGGECIARGDAGHVIACYLDAVRHDLQHPGDETLDARPIRLRDCHLRDHDGNRVTTARPGQSLTMHAVAEVLADVPFPGFAMTIWVDPQNIGYAINTRAYQEPLAPLKAGQSVELSFPFAAPFYPIEVVTMLLVGGNPRGEFYEPDNNSIRLSVRDDGGTESVSPNPFAIRVRD